MENDELLRLIRVDLTAIRADLAATEARLREYVHDTETKIVGEFYKWSRTNEARIRTTEVTIGPLIERLGAMEARLLDVEKRLNS